MQPLMEGYGQWLFSDEPVRVASDAALNVRKVGNEFPG